MPTLRKDSNPPDPYNLPTFTIDDVDDGVVKRFKQWAVNKGRINKSVLSEDKFVMLEKLHLVKDGYLTNAAMLLFSNDPEKWQLGAYVKIGFFETDSDLVYQDEIHGSILDQIDKIVEIIYLKYMKAKISYVGMQRIERYFVSEEALREALLNALCHKDYSRGIPIQISIYNDIGLILLGFGIVQIGLSLKSHDASQRANGFLTFFGGVIIAFAKDILDLIM